MGLIPAFRIVECHKRIKESDAELQRSDALVLYTIFFLNLVTKFTDKSSARVGENVCG